jgi:predicted amidohydrolase
MKIAICQISPTIGKTEENRSKIELAITTAAEGGAQVVLLPELANTGYSFRSKEELYEFAEAPDGVTLTSWRQLAKRFSISIVGGFAESNIDGHVYNSAAVVDQSGVRVIYRKTHLWGDEKLYFTAGDGQAPIVDLPGCRLGLMVCYDIEFPEWVRSVALRGADLICCPVNLPLYPRPAGTTPSEVVRYQAQAAFNRVFIATADRSQSDRDQEWLGASVVIDPDGFVISRINLGNDFVQIVEIDPHESRDKTIGDSNDVFKDRRVDLY